MACVPYIRVVLKNTRVGACTHCKNLTRRTDRHWQTINPYNKNAQGLPKTEEEIMVELRAEVAKRNASPLECRSCESRKVPPCRS